VSVINGKQAAMPSYHELTVSARRGIFTYTRMLRDIDANPTPANMRLRKHIAKALRRCYWDFDDHPWLTYLRRHKALAEAIYGYNVGKRLRPTGLHHDEPLWIRMEDSES
jgi:hypothetical protein